MIMVEYFEVEGPCSLTNDDDFYLLKFEQRCAENTAGKQKASKGLLTDWGAKPHNDLPVQQVLSLLSNAHTFGVKHNKITQQVCVYVFFAHNLTVEEMRTIICDEEQAAYTVVATGYYKYRGLLIRRKQLLGYKRPHYPGERKHDTISNYDFAYEGSNTYYYSQEELSAPVIANDWPEHIVNASIVPYLLPEQACVANGNFFEFVKSWYQSSCAIVYFSPDNDAKVISTGTLVSPDKMVTARHNFIPTYGTGLGKPYIRFFKYSIFPTKRSGQMCVLEQYLDVPSCGTHNHEANGLTMGLDAV